MKFLSTMTIVLMMVILLCSTGCQNLIKKEDPAVFTTGTNISDASTAVDEGTEKIKVSTEEIKAQAQDIFQEATMAESKVSPSNKTKVSPHLEEIKTSSTKIVEQTNNIDRATVKLVTAKDLLGRAEEQANAMQDEIDVLQEEKNLAIEQRDKAIEDKNSAIQRTLRWVIVGCIFGIGIFAVVFFVYGSKIGLVGAGASAVILAVASFVEKYFVYLALAGGGIALVVVGILLYTIFVSKRGLREVIETVELAQDNMTKEAREKLFGKTGETGMMNEIQSKTTMDIVRREKQRLSNLWNYAKKKNGTAKEPLAEPPPQ